MRKIQKLKLTEKMIQHQILGYLRTVGVYCWKHWQGPMSTFKGVSDIIGIMKDGRFIAVEVKGKKGKVSLEQEQFLDIIKRFNGIAILARSLEDVMAVVKLPEKQK